MSSSGLKQWIIGGALLVGSSVIVCSGIYFAVSSSQLTRLEKLRQPHSREMAALERESTRLKVLSKRSAEKIAARDEEVQFLKTLHESLQAAVTPVQTLQASTSDPEEASQSGPVVAFRVNSPYCAPGTDCPPLRMEANCSVIKGRISGGGIVTDWEESDLAKYACSGRKYFVIAGQRLKIEYEQPPVSVEVEVPLQKILIQSDSLGSKPLEVEVRCTVPPKSRISDPVIGKSEWHTAPPPAVAACAGQDTFEMDGFQWKLTHR